MIIYYVGFIYNCISYDICNSTDILCIILWLSPYPWDAPVKGYMEVNKNWKKFKLKLIGLWLSCYTNILVPDLALSVILPALS